MAESIEFRDPASSLSAMLLNVSIALPDDNVSIRQLLEQMGEQGMLLLCVFLALPFLFLVSIPGLSTALGVAIILSGVGVTLNRIPWLPRWLLERPLSTAPLKQAFEQGARVVVRLEHVVRPRWRCVTRAAVLNVMHGLALVLAGVLLMFPLGLVPFSNTLPAIAILCLAVGMLERDGLLIVGGYVMNMVAMAYFGALTAGAVLGGRTLLRVGGW